MWARIENNVVIELTNTDPTGRFNPSLVWVTCPTNVVEGYLYDNAKKTFAPPPGPTASDLVLEYQQSAKTYIESAAPTMQRISLAMNMGNCTPTDAAVVDWNSWFSNVRAEIKATAVPTDSGGNAITVQQKYPKPTIYPTGS